MQDFQKKVVVVTGAASGIGRAIAGAFAKERALLVIADIETDPLEAAEHEIRASGVEVLAVRTDVGDAGSVAALAQATLDRFGAVHVVCNNAGVGQSFRPVWEFSTEYWQWLLGINLWGVIHGVRTFVPILLRQGCEGHVVNTSSVAGLVSYPLPYLGVYSAAKHAVVSISETLAADLALIDSKIKVSVLCPGFVRTQIMNSERHRPANLATEGHANAEIEAMWRAGIDAGTDPTEIAARVLSAIREERLYILPNPDFNEAIRVHAENLVLQRNPVMPNAGAASAER
jgi:NAD(P)-dependent dehydrogenase (short-subunit alcohol dehydrogenase family)